MEILHKVGFIQSIFFRWKAVKGIQKAGCDTLINRNDLDIGYVFLSSRFSITPLLLDNAVQLSQKNNRIVQSDKVLCVRRS